MKFSKDTLYLLLNEIMKSKNTKYLIITLGVVVILGVGGYLLNKNKSNSGNESTKNEITQNSNEPKKEDKKEVDQNNETKKDEAKKDDTKNNTDKKEDKTNVKLSEDIEITEERAIRLIKKVVIPNLGPKFQNAQLDFKSEGKNTVNKEKCFLIAISQKGKDNKVESVGKYAVAINGRTIYQFNSKTNAYEKYNNKY